MSHRMVQPPKAQDPKGPNAQAKGLAKTSHMSRRTSLERDGFASSSTEGASGSTANLSGKADSEGIPTTFTGEGTMALATRFGCPP
jgi:hypothetical protein